MHVISWKVVSDFIGTYPVSRNSLTVWFKLMKNNEFANFIELRKIFKTADQVGKFTVFNIAGNNYRIIAAVHYNRKKVYIRYVLTHQESDKNKWKEE